MKLYELKKNSIEIKKEDMTVGCAVNDTNASPELIKKFRNKEEALEELKKYNTEIDEFSSATGTMCNVTEYYVEENNMMKTESGTPVETYGKSVNKRVNP